MTQQSSYPSDRLDRKMTSEEFTKVIAAISEGKYSWACVLILQIAGYNPLHYIPYRTYNRLVKDNLTLHKQSRKIEDLEHLETSNQPQIRGGSCDRIFSALHKLRRA
jgi:hypothetical protein